jgi:integrase
MATTDLHNYKRQLERQVELIADSTEMSAENKKAAFAFKEYLLSEGIGVAKIGRYLLDIRKFSRMLNKPFGEADDKDMRRVIAELEQTDLAPESKKCFKVMVRKLYRFLRGMTDKGAYPPEVKWISIALRENTRKLPEELLTEDESLAIVQACDNIRDKAFIASLAESGCRISEIGTMRIKHVSFEPHGARLTVNGKTGMRKILVISSAPYLQEWINSHPKNYDSESPIWYNPQSKDGFLTYSRMVDIIKLASRRGGIRKHVHAHLFRHSRATHLAKIMSEAAMKHYFGWTQGSKMAGIYVHMSGRDADDAILRANNLATKQEIVESKFKPLMCLRCKRSNSATNRFCNICGFVLNQESAQEILLQEATDKGLNTMLDKLINDKEVFEILARKLKEHAAMH